MNATLAERFARYAAGVSFDALPAPVVHEVKRRIVDSLGCAFGAWDAEPCEIARRTAALAVAETEGASGRELITAIALAYEIQCRLCDAASLRARGWDHLMNPSIFACSRIAGWCAHIIEQHDHNRLIRPRSLYTGHARRKIC